MSAADRFWTNVSGGDFTSCWEWQASIRPDGYGRWKIANRDVVPHRFAYEHMVGPIPEGLHLDHLCRNKACVNPWHLDPVTARVNLLRGVGFAATNAAKTHCPSGHAYTPDNTYVLASQRKRYCRTCKREQGRKGPPASRLMLPGAVPSSSRAGFPTQQTERPAPPPRDTGRSRPTGVIVTQRISISSSAFEDLIRRLPAYVDVVITADATHKFCELDSVTYVAPIEQVAS